MTKNDKAWKEREETPGKGAAGKVGPVEGTDPLDLTRESWFRASTRVVAQSRLIDRFTQFVWAEVRREESRARGGYARLLQTVAKAKRNGKL